MQYTQYNLEQNLIIKKPVPSVGVICSNRRRVERIVKSVLSDVFYYDEYNSAWQLDLYEGTFKNKKMFIAAIPVGAAGAAFVIQQLSVAGAKFIIRYGSNDDPYLTKERMNEVILVDKADNLYGLMQSSGAPYETWGEELNASPLLLSALQKEAQQLQLPTRLAICHHIEDYGAYAFPNSAGEYSQNILNKLQELESKNPHLLHCRDMESAALYYRAILDNFHAATVLQNIPKFAGTHQTYDGDHGEIAKEYEKKFSELVFNTLFNFL